MTGGAMRAWSVVRPGPEVVGAVMRATGGYAVGDRVGVAWLRRTDEAAPTACAGPRTCARPPGTRAGTPTAVTRSTRPCPTPSPTGCRTAAVVRGHHRLPRARRADDLGCTGSAAAPICAPRSRSPRVPPCTCSPAGRRHGGRRSTWAPPPHRTRTPRRPSPWTARSCSPRSAIRSRWHCAPSNTREDAREFLALAARYSVRAITHTYPLSRTGQALRDLKAGRFDGAAVLVR